MKEGEEEEKEEGWGTGQGHMHDARKSMRLYEIVMVCTVWVEGSKISAQQWSLTPVDRYRERGEEMRPS